MRSTIAHIFFETTRVMVHSIRRKPEIKHETLLMDYPDQNIREWFTKFSEEERKQVRHLHIVYDGFGDEGLPRDLSCFPNLRRLKVESTRLWVLHVDRLPKTLVQLDMRGCINTDFSELSRLQEACNDLEILALDAEKAFGDEWRNLLYENESDDDRDDHENLPVVGPLPSLNTVILDDEHVVNDHNALPLGQIVVETLKQRFLVGRFLPHHQVIAIDRIPNNGIASHILRVHALDRPNTSTDQ